MNSHNLTLSLPEKFKSFPQGFQFQFEGSLMLLLGVNGSGKTQLLNLLSKFDPLDNNRPVSSEVSLDGSTLEISIIAYRSFSQNAQLNEINSTNSQIFESSFNQVIQHYKKHRLNPENTNVKGFRAATRNAKEILVEKFSEESFSQAQLSDDMIRSALTEEGFVWTADDLFTNTIGEIFYTYSLNRFELFAKAGKEQTPLSPSDIESELGKAPWCELNDLFEELRFNYRFKDNYEIKNFALDETPALYQLNSSGELDPDQKRPIRFLSDGEKSILSLCFGSLNGSKLQEKKLLLLDEIDAVLNPSLVQMFVSTKTSASSEPPKIV
ncbi:MAG: ATP-binding cassette domain-containing protein [Verrucomicrobiales bacterium]|nr:ATP-binding cassette domain-containing protein [Verrucomicrobiales bacterium]